MTTFVVIDSNPLEGQAYSHIIQKNHLQIHYIEQAFTSAQGLSLLSEVQPDIAVIDTETIGGSQGLTLLKAIHDISPLTSVVLTSITIANAYYLQSAMRFGIHNYYLKPLSNQDFYALIAQLESEKRKFNDFHISSREQFRTLIEAFQSDSHISPESAVENLWSFAAKSGLLDLEAFRTTCIEFATSIIYYSGGRKYQPEALASAYSHFIREAMCCSYIEDLRQQLEVFLRICSDILIQNLHSADNIQVEKAKSLIISYIDTNQSVTLNRIAQEVFLSPAYLSRLFKKHERITFIDYIQNCRLEKAKRLLRETNDSIESIASQCGYSECNSFRRLFKKKEGISSGDYRKMHRQS